MLTLRLAARGGTDGQEPRSEVSVFPKPATPQSSGSKAALPPRSPVRTVRVGVTEFRPPLNMANRPRVTGDQRVMGDEENALNLGLSDQQAVERILVQVG